MAFVTDKEELKPGLIIFRRGDLQRRDWYCRVRLPKATRYKTIALKTTDRTTARDRAYDHDSEIRFRLKHNVPVFDRPFREIAEEFIVEQQARAQRGEISVERPEKIRSVVNRHLNRYVGAVQIATITPERWRNYPAWRRASGEGRMRRHGNTRPLTETELAAAKAEVAEKTAQAARRGREITPEIKDAWVMVSDATIRFEMSIYRAIMNYAVAKQYAPAHHRIEGKVALEKLRRDAFTLEEYRRLYNHARGPWIKAASNGKTRWYRETAYDFLLIMCNTGMRPSEARNLRWRDVTDATDKNGQEVVVLSVRGKGKSRQLVAPKKGVGRFLERLRARSKNTALGAPVFSTYEGESAKSLYKNLIEDLLTETGLREGPSGIPRSTYSFRHTYATLRLQEGVSELLLAEQMGTSVKMIQEHYGHVDNIKHADLVLQGMNDWAPPEVEDGEAQPAAKPKSAAEAKKQAAAQRKAQAREKARPRSPD